MRPRPARPSTQADGELKPALLSLLAGVDAAAARDAIAAHDGSVAQALAALGGQVPAAPTP